MIAGFILGCICAGVACLTAMRLFLARPQIPPVVNIPPIDTGKTEILQMLSNHRTEINASQDRIHDTLTRTGESAAEMARVATSLHDLERVLKNQKARGSLGEASLGLILSNILPADAYELQHVFENREVVDAVVRTPGGLIPIDSKFPLEAYMRLLDCPEEQRPAIQRTYISDLKKRIDETAKYVRGGTTPFALMFLAAEGPFHDLLDHPAILQYALERSVFVCSPTTFTMYLQTVLHGLRGFRIETEALEIAKRAADLRKHMVTYQEAMDRVGANLQAATNKYGEAVKALSKVNSDLDKISS